MTSTIYTIPTIDDLIKSHNPFAGHIVVRPPQIWGKSFPDVPSINVHASNAVFQAVAQVRQGQRETVGITITAEKGLGKSHIISRIRHRLQTDDSALFVYMSKYDNLNQIKYQFLQTVASSLRAFGNYQGVMQWQELAGALINEAKKCNYTPQQYINIFPSWLNKYSTKVVDHLTDLVLKIKPDINNPYIVKAILWTLSSVHANYATYWLSGLELSQAQAEAMGLPNPTIKDREAEALSTVRQIFYITSDYRIPVICFDELDIIDVDENGFTAAQVIANLAKDLYNNLKCGVLLLAMYPETWRDQVKALPQAEAVIDRLTSERYDRQPIILNYLNSEDIVAIVSQWLKEFYEDNKQTPPYPLYPFDEDKLRQLGKGKPTIRSVLKWCADNFLVDILGKSDDSDPIDKIHPVEPVFKNELANVDASIEIHLNDEGAISDALWFGFYNLIGETVEGVKIEDVGRFQVTPCYLDFKISGTKDGEPVKIGVAINQQSGGIGVQATLKQLIDYTRFNLTRGCLIRSKKIGTNATRARTYLKELLYEKGGEWVLLQCKNINPLIASFFVYANCDTYGLSQEQICDFIKQKQLAINNPLIREILSDPSGQEPDNLINEDLPIRIPQGVSNLVDGIDFSNIA